MAKPAIAPPKFRPSKARGQNFLTSPGLARRIAASAGQSFSTAFEVGPGFGALTEALLGAGARVVAVEIDGRLTAQLRLKFAGVPDLTIHESDALKFDWALALSDCPGPRIFFGNLPYSIFAPLLEKLFQNSALFTEAIVCLPSEVADRIVSAGGRGMGPITLLAHRFCYVRKKILNLPPGAFRPRPKVSSAVVRLAIRPGVVWSESDARVPRMLFSGRRKKLRSVLPAEILSDAGRRLGKPIADRRIDELGVEDAAVLYRISRDPFEPTPRMS